MAFDMPESNLLGFIFEALFYGAYVFVFIEHMRVLYRKRSKTWSYLYFQATSFLLFVLITAHMVVDIARAMRAFTGDMGTPNSPMTYFEEFNTLDSRLRTGIYDAVTLVSDLFLVYRCFIVWGSNYFVALVPFLLFVADIVIAAWATDSLNKTRSGDHFSMTLVGLRAKYMFIVTLALNLLCTVLIAYRIWYIQRQVAGYCVHSVHPQQKLSNVIIIIIESAAIYSGILIALIVTDVTGSPSFFMLLNLVGSACFLAIDSSY
ncbi:unnamed protein product [Cyclocybe aegerita]|uniref:Uncharacterized protein n=1 Tax=Cyclocybe aegerita TaxID=1973307 RepID=A0A8S0XNF7_CYCAE|nr:unnamed protein product [Cyclocybe aegerita]